MGYLRVILISVYSTLLIVALFFNEKKIYYERIYVNSFLLDYIFIENSSEVLFVSPIDYFIKYLK